MGLSNKRLPPLLASGGWRSRLCRLPGSQPVRISSPWYMIRDVLILQALRSLAEHYQWHNKDLRQALTAQRTANILLCSALHFDGLGYRITFSSTYWFKNRKVLLSA